MNLVNTREALLDLTDGLEDAAIDKYSYTRDLYMKVRSRQTGGTLPQGEDDNIDIDELVDNKLPVEARVCSKIAVFHHYDNSYFGVFHRCHSHENGVVS